MAWKMAARWPCSYIYPEEIALFLKKSWFSVSFSFLVNFSSNLKLSLHSKLFFVFHGSFEQICNDLEGDAGKDYLQWQIHSEQ